VSMLNLDPTTLPDIDSKVSEFISPEKQWDTTKLSQYLPNDVIQLVLSIPLPITDVTDSFCWGYSSSSDFYTKSTTWKAHDNISRDQPRWKYHWI